MFLPAGGNVVAAGRKSVAQERELRRRPPYRRNGRCRCHQEGPRDSLAVSGGGAAAQALDQIQEALQPEALCGFVEDGQRAFFAIFDLADPSQIPVISEPLYQRANVKLTLTPL
jgi:hypothetical protein